MSKDSFDIVYQVDDGYAGGKRPQIVTIEYSDLEGCGDNSEVKEVISEIIEDDFKMNITWSADNIDDCVDWFFNGEDT